MSTQLYSMCEVYLDGAKLTEETSVRVSHTSKAQVVETVARGFAGMSPGSPMVSISIENGVPSADFEFAPFNAIKTLQVVELTIFAAGRTLTSKGFVIDSSLSHGVNSPSSLSMEFVGEFAVFE